MNQESLKEQNKKHLILFLAWNIIITIVFYSSTFKISGSKSIMDEVVSEKGLFMVFAPILIIVLNGFISSNFKHSLIFIKCKNQLPGHRIFTKYIKNDTRIDEDNLKLKYGELPTNPAEQNKLWYKIYLKHSDKAVIASSHKNFLLTRDFSAVSFLFLLVSPLIFFTDNQLIFKFGYVLYLFVQLIILIIVTQNYAIRFACNVLAVDSNQ
jgi:hypothetical protein